MIVSMTEKLTKRDHRIDILKTIAIFGVIVIHISSKAYSDPTGSFNWISSLFWGSLTRASVPLFLMCSGALLLDPKKELTLKKLYLRNIARMVTAMLFWAMLYKVYHLLTGHALSVSGIWQSLKEVLLLKQESHFYYIHIIILFYAFLPITRVITQRATKGQLEYALAVWFALGILYPTLRPFWPFSLLGGIPAQYQLNMTFASIGYGILGYYLMNYRLSVRLSCGLAVLGFAFVFGGTYAMSMRTGSLYQNFLEGMSIGVALMAAGIFGTIKAIDIKLSGAVSFAVTYISKASFCIYLVHIFFIYIFLLFGFSVTAIPCIISIPLLSAAIMLLSIFVYRVISRIPIINRWII